MKHSLFREYLSAFGLSLALLGTTTMAGEDRSLYTMDNAASANHVLIFHQDHNGQVTSGGAVATGGLGAGAGLSSQGSILLSHDGRWLFVCNPGSDEISVFASEPAGLQLVDKVSSGGRFPLSLTLRRNLLYVLNAGGEVGDSDNITGFVFSRGRLEPLADSTRALSGTNTGPAQISFSEDGNTLIVAERLSNLIDTFSLDDDGLSTAHKIFDSAGATPFGFAVGRNDRIFVSEAGGGAANASSASSYSVSDAGDLAVITGAAPTKQTAACWLILSHDGRFIYTADAGSGTLSGFGVASDGTLHLLDPNGITAVIGTGSHPVDMAQSRDGRMLFVLANGNGTLGTFRVTGSGSLQPLGFVNGLPTSAAGLAAR